MTRKEYWIWLCSVQGITVHDIDRLLEKYEDPEEIYKRTPEELGRTGKMNASLIRDIMDSREKGSFASLMKRMKGKDIRFVCLEDKEFPERMMQIPERPYGLFYRGCLPDNDIPSCGMVGARKASLYGKEMAQIFAGALAGCGVQIISGMALGIDGISQKAAIEKGGRTFAVLGSGADVIYPADNIGLYYDILENKGGIISEYPPGTYGYPKNFPARNRIISALGDRLLVIEAKKRSGTSITVKYALEQGRDVYALPGRVTDPLSEGCNMMIADGAGVLTSPEALIEEISGSCRMKPEKKEQMSEGTGGGLYNLIKKGYMSLQELTDLSQKKPEEVQTELTMLKLSGLIKEVSQNHYVINR